MPCDHIGPPEVIAMTEAWLREHSISQERWPGAHAIFGENTPGGMWASVVTGIERRGDQWIVTRLDRNREPVGETGLRVLLKD